MSKANIQSGMDSALGECQRCHVCSLPRSVFRDKCAARIHQLMHDECTLSFVHKIQSSMLSILRAMEALLMWHCVLHCCRPPDELKVHLSSRFLH